MSEERKVLLSLKNVSVKFNVRGRVLTAIRNVSLDIYENESIAIVGESGSGKSVLTKTFAGMLDSNGYVSEGSIIFSDDDLSHTNVKLTPANLRYLEYLSRKYNKYSVKERGAAEYQAIKQKKADIKHVKALTEDEEEAFRVRFKDVHDDLTDTLIDVPVKAGEFEHEYILEDIKDDSRVIYVETNKKASETEIGDGTEAASEEQISEEKPAEEKAEEEAPAEEKPAEEMQL